MTEINPEALRSAIQERIQLAEAADGDWAGIAVLDDAPDAVVLFVDEHLPSFMLRVYRQWLDVLDRHRRAEDEPLCCFCWDGHEDVEDWLPWPCPEVCSIAAALGVPVEEGT